MKLEYVIRRARRYGESKKGAEVLSISYDEHGIRVAAGDFEQKAARHMTLAEYGQFTSDEAIARLCDLIDQVLHNLRDLRSRKR